MVLEDQGEQGRKPFEHISDLEIVRATYSTVAGCRKERKAEYGKDLQVLGCLVVTHGKWCF